MMLNISFGQGLTFWDPWWLEPLSLGVAGVRRVKFRSDDMSEKGCTQNYISQYIAVQKKLIHGSRK